MGRHQNCATDVSLSFMMNASTSFVGPSVVGTNAEYPFDANLAVRIKSLTVCLSVFPLCLILFFSAAEAPRLISACVFPSMQTSLADANAMLSSRSCSINSLSLAPRKARHGDDACWHCPLLTSCGWTAHAFRTACLDTQQLFVHVFGLHEHSDDVCPHSIPSAIPHGDSARATLTTLLTRTSS